ncbi:MAG: hypothetical protein P9L92_08610 [Candidatus Electryonea clarkiae]|nr:hypothetical protein [Candidatus Electryonea clarkiae]
MRRLFLGAIISIMTFMSFSDVSSQSYELRGSLREFVKVFSQSPNEVDLSETRFKLEFLSAHGENSAFKAKSYYIYDGLNKKGTWDFQEAYIDYYSSYLDVRVGRQVIAWGKADEINPTDILNPQNLSNMTENKSIRKIGLLSTKTELKLYDFILEGIWKPEFDNMKLPPMDSRWAFFTIPGLEELPEPEYPQNRIQDTEWAFKLSRTVSLFDLSVSYFDGWDNMVTPVMTFNPTSQQIEMDRLKFFRTKMIGADFAGSIASFGIWGEAAYFNTDENDPLVKNPYLQYVLGTDYTFGYNITLNVQYFQEMNETEADKEITSKLGVGMPLQQAASFRVNRDFGYGEAHSIELFGYYDIKESGLLLQPKLILSPEDAFDVETGVIVFAAEEESLFGRFEENNQVYIKCTYSF